MLALVGVARGLPAIGCSFHGAKGCPVNVLNERAFRFACTPYATARRLERLVLDVSWTIIMRSGCLWLLGVPLPIIILLWLITGHA